MDFTIKKYTQLLKALQNKGFFFQTFVTYQKTPQEKVIILRHDVDRLPENAYSMAQIEHSLGIKGSYYFRVAPESWDEVIMRRIVELGHEVGYHYEDVDLVLRKIKDKSKKTKVEDLIDTVLRKIKDKSKKIKVEDLIDAALRKIKDKSKKIKVEDLIDLAYESFCWNLEKMRKVVDIKTICMHGSPRSRYDNRMIWEKYDYRDFGISGEPYFDVDFNEFAYFTDTGRRWNGHNVSMRDKVNSIYNFNFKSTQQIIENVDKLPDKMMFTIHPERWTNSLFPWTKNLILQNIKNMVKRTIITFK